MPLFGKRDRPLDHTRQLPIRVGDYEDSIYGRADAIMAALRVGFAQSNQIGVTFGPDRGLEVASAWTAEVVPNPLEFRPMGQRAADAVIEGIRAGIMHVQDLEDVLGLDGRSLARNAVRKSDYNYVRRPYDEAVQVLLAMSKHDFNGMDTWFKDDQFAVGTTAIFLVGLLRLQARGTALTY